jgi:photosystem II stability/assembly factor-like uncharacterized protein
VSFVSTQDGWLLGQAPCGPSSCLSLLRTHDGGRSWSSIPTPAAVPANGSYVTGGVGQVRFADTSNGWLFNPDLWSTHDGGATWSRSAVPDSATALETNGRQAVAVTFPTADATHEPGYSIWSTPVVADAWTSSSTTIPFGAGPVAVTQVVLHGAAGWILENDRTVIGAARLDASRWVTWQPPCLYGGGPANLAASTATDIVAVCSEGFWNDKPHAIHMYVSRDGGTTFRQAAAALPLESASPASPAPGVVFVTRYTNQGADGIIEVLATFDGGARWITVHRSSPNATVRYLGFTTSDQGVLIETDAQPRGRLLMTRDGGRHWVDVSP